MPYRQAYPGHILGISKISQILMVIDFRHLGIYFSYILCENNSKRTPYAIQRIKDNTGNRPDWKYSHTRSDRSEGSLQGT